MPKYGADDPKPCYLCKREFKLLYSWSFGIKLGSHAICEDCLKEQQAKEKSN